MFKSHRVKSIHITGLLSLFLVILFAVACGSNSQPTKVPVQLEPTLVQVQEEPTVTPEPAVDQIINIGVLGPLTGAAAADGEEMVRGAQLAVKEINAGGGVLGYTFKVIPGDTKDQVPDAVVSAIQRLTADPDLHCLMTGYASTTNFEIENISQIDMPYILAANATQTYDIISKDPSKYSTIWSLVPSYDAYETELPKLMEQWASEGKITLRSRKVAIVTSDNPYSKTISEGLKENFEAAGWTITVDEMVPFQDVLDWRTIIAQIRMDPPDLVINTDYLPANEAAFLEQFLEDPTPSYMFMQYGPSVPEFYELTRDKSTGVLFNILGGLIRSPKNDVANEFLAKFKEEYGVESGDYGYYLYSSVYLYAKALQNVGDPTDHLAVGIAIGELDVKETASGRVKFDPETHLAIQGEEYIPIQFYQLWDGQRVLLKPDSLATGEIQVPSWIK